MSSDAIQGSSMIIIDEAKTKNFKYYDGRDEILRFIRFAKKNRVPLIIVDSGSLSSREYIRLFDGSRTYVMLKAPTNFKEVYGYKRAMPPSIYLPMHFIRKYIEDAILSHRYIHTQARKLL